MWCQRQFECGQTDNHDGAAVAEQHGITVLHYDSDYDVISEFTGVQAMWVVERGGIA